MSAPLRGRGCGDYRCGFGGGDNLFLGGVLAGVKWGSYPGPPRVLAARGATPPASGEGWFPARCFSLPAGRSASRTTGGNRDRGQRARTRFKPLIEKVPPSPEAGRVSERSERTGGGLFASALTPDQFGRMLTPSISRASSAISSCALSGHASARRMISARDLFMATIATISTNLRRS